MRRTYSVVFVWVAIALNAAAMGLSLYLFRHSIFCGLGVGSYSFIFYVPSLLVVCASIMFDKTPSTALTLKVLFVINGAYILLLLVQGACFSCVDICVEARRGF